MQRTERLESMSQSGRLRLFRQEDGDIIVTVVQKNGYRASVEICTPMSGGGGSRRTWKALARLAAAMAADNLDPEQSGRRPDDLDEEEQKLLVEWGKDLRQSEIHDLRFQLACAERDRDYWKEQAGGLAKSASDPDFAAKVQQELDER